MMWDKLAHEHLRSVFDVDFSFIQFLVEELLTELDPNHDGQISEEEFMLILKYI